MADWGNLLYGGPPSRQDGRDSQDPSTGLGNTTATLGAMQAKREAMRARADQDAAMQHLNDQMANMPVFGPQAAPGLRGDNGQVGFHVQGGYDAPTPPPSSSFQSGSFRGGPSQPSLRLGGGVDPSAMTHQGMDASAFSSPAASRNAPAPMPAEDPYPTYSPLAHGDPHARAEADVANNQPHGFWGHTRAALLGMARGIGNIGGGIPGQPSGLLSGAIDYGTGSYQTRERDAKVAEREQDFMRQDMLADQENTRGYEAKVGAHEGGLRDQSIHQQMEIARQDQALKIKQAADYLPESFLFTAKSKLQNGMRLTPDDLAGLTPEERQAAEPLLSAEPAIVEQVLTQPGTGLQYTYDPRTHSQHLLAPGFTPANGSNLGMARMRAGQDAAGYDPPSGDVEKEVLASLNGRFKSMGELEAEKTRLRGVMDSEGNGLFGESEAHRQARTQLKALEDATNASSIRTIRNGLRRRYTQSKTGDYAGDGARTGFEGGLDE